MAIIALCLLTPWLAHAQDARDGYAPYVAQAGDTLIGIAEELDTTLESLLAVNDMVEVGELFAGQQLLVPRLGSVILEPYAVRPGDTLFSIARAYQTSVGILMGLNALSDESAIDVGWTLLAPRARHAELETHIVAAGESLFGISRRYHTDVALLKSLNGIGDERDLRAGQKLFVPPVDDTRFEVYVTAPGDSLYNISRMYNTSLTQLRALNGIAGGQDLAVGRSLLVPRIDETVFDSVLVEPGDSLFGLARRHGLSLAALQALNRLGDPGAIAAGQRLLVPKLENAVLDLHITRAGESLASLAERYATSVELLRTLNAIDDPDLIQVDARLLVPKMAAPLARPGFGVGIQLFIDGGNAPALAAQVQQLGAGWVKIDVPWSRIEPERGRYDYADLDATVGAMALAELKILLNVFDAPAWSRQAYTAKLNSRMQENGGPPENLDDFARFLANLATRYAGLVSAYEIWKAPNLLKYWTVPIYDSEPARTADGDYGIPDGVELGARHYLPLLRVGYETIRSLDSAALVISAGLAPVGLSDGYNSIDTGAYLRDMLEYGAAELSDAIGAVFSASAVPPTLSCCDKPPGVDSHYESFLQYFPDLMRFYADALAEHGLAEMPIVVTQVGWGTREGSKIAIPSSGYEWLNYTSEREQALYVTQAYQIAQDIDSVSAMFLYNLNGCAVADEEACFFSLVDAAGQRRPVFAAFEALLN